LDTLWPELDAAEHYLNNAASTLRGVLRSHERGGLLETVSSRTAYQLAEQGRLWVDYEHCQAVLEEARRIGHTTVQGLGLLKEAEGYLSRGPFLADELGEWCVGQRENVRTMHYRCQMWLAEAYEVQQEVWQAEKVVEGLLREDATDESALCRLMSILHAQGLTTEALRRCKQVAALLGREGLTLSRETEELAKQLQSRPRVMAQAVSLLAVPSCADLHEMEGPGKRETQASSAPSPLCDLSLSPPSSAQPMQALFSSMHIEGAGAADASLDWARWFGLKQYDIIHVIDGWCGSRDRYDQEIHMLVDREIKMMDEILWQYQQQDEQISARRQFLFALVALPLTLQSRSHDLRADRDIEEFLRLCSVSLSTCWHLMRGQGIAVLEEVVAQYVPTLMSLVRRPSPSQPLAARLATQAKFLQALLCMHRLDFAGRELHCLEAVQYSRLSGSGKMQVAALQYLGYFYVYYLAGRSEKAIAIFLEALRLLGTEDSLFRSNIYIGLADAYAQRGEEKQALESIELAKQHCPNDPEKIPVFSMLRVAGLNYIGEKEEPILTSPATPLIETSISEPMLHPPGV
jgi:DNA-binding SARP family transcriptional activator